MFRRASQLQLKVLRSHGPIGRGGGEFSLLNCRSAGGLGKVTGLLILRMDERDIRRETELRRPLEAMRSNFMRPPTSAKLDSPARFWLQ